MYVLLEGDRPKAWAEAAVLAGAVHVEVPAGVDADHLNAYRLTGGAWIYDPLPPEPPLPTQGERLEALEAAMLEMILGGVEDG